MVARVKPSSAGRLVAVPLKWMLLLVAIATEVFATTALRAGVDEPLWNIAAALGYITAFLFLGLALRAGMAIASAYAIWGALGVVATTFIGTWVFSEYLSALNWVGIGAIVVGVVLVEARKEPAQ